MKILLACLMCLVLTMSQAFAISGGPFGGPGHVLVTGTYAGVLVPIIDPTVGVADNSLALFTFRIPVLGLANGTAALFRNGLFYPGTITGSADPDSATVTAVLNATFQITVAESLDPSILFVFTYSGNGTINGKIAASKTHFTTTSVRVKGTASLTYVNDAFVGGITPDPVGDSGGPILYKISGFKQSINAN